MFASDIKKFLGKEKISSYPSKVKIWKWVSADIPENIPSKYLDKIKEFKLTNYSEVEFDFQEMINQEVYITPEQAFNRGVQLDASNVSYGDNSYLAKSNVIDLTNRAQDLKNQFIYNKSNDLANVSLQNYLNSLKKQKQDLEDSSKEIK